MLYFTSRKERSHILNNKQRLLYLFEFSMENALVKFRYAIV